MEIARKELGLGIAGLGVAVVGVVWFALAATTDVLQGMVQIFGYPMGPALVLCGLIIAGVYFYRRGRILKLTGGKNLLAQWKDGYAVYIAPDCAYIDGTLHLWSGIGGRLKQVKLVEKQSYGSVATELEIEYANSVQRRDLITSRWTTAWESKKLSVRVPADQIAAIKTVVEKLQARQTA